MVDVVISFWTFFCGNGNKTVIWGELNVEGVHARVRGTF
jgi:hypothetical protein